jgi:hypothetical protein
MTARFSSVLALPEHRVNKVYVIILSAAGKGKKHDASLLQQETLLTTE